MTLNSQEAGRLVDLVEQAKDLDAAIAAAAQAFSFLVGQLHALGDSANGYPRNPIDGNVWKEGYALTSVCDRFADAVSRWQQRRGEEQATRLAVSMALQVVAHYPEEIFPRAVRNAKCCESLGKMSDAVEGYRCVVGDFDKLHLEELLGDSEPLEVSQKLILTSVRDALSGLQRIAPGGLTEAELSLHKRVAAVLGGPRASTAG
jgi:hypothetical protein